MSRNTRASHGPLVPLVPVVTLTATPYLLPHTIVSWVRSFTHMPSFGLTTPWKVCRYCSHFSDGPAEPREVEPFAHDHRECLEGSESLVQG